jgi:hypothetical protein
VIESIASDFIEYDPFFFLLLENDDDDDDDDDILAESSNSSLSLPSPSSLSSSSSSSDELSTENLAEDEECGATAIGEDEFRTDPGKLRSGKSEETNDLGADDDAWKLQRT